MSHCANCKILHRRAQKAESELAKLHKQLSRTTTTWDSPERQTEAIQRDNDMHAIERAYGREVYGLPGTGKTELALQDLADFDRETLPYVVMKETESDVFGTRRVLVAAFSNLRDAETFATHCAGGESVYSVWKWRAKRRYRSLNAQE